MQALKRRERTVLVLAALAILAGAYAFVFGQGLAALLVPVCSDFSWQAAPRCRQPLLYITGGAILALIGLLALLTIFWRRLRRKRRPSSRAGVR